MVTLGLVGVPAAAYTYPAFKAAAAAGTALGATFSAAQAAALATLAAGAAAALGAGVGGFLLGQAILAGLEQPPILPDMGEYYEVGLDGGTVRIVYDFFVGSEPVFTNAVSAFIPTPMKGMFFRVSNNASVWFVVNGAGQRQDIVTVANTPSGTRFEVKDFLREDGTKVTPTKRLPSYVPKNPDLPKPQPPTPITIPGVPSFPVTPIAVPNPANDEPEEGEERSPGLVIQIPETGQQFTFTPTGVSVTNYNAPNREASRVPAPELPPGGKAATPRCCDDGAPEPDPINLDEIICRLKALQDEVLNDGFDRVSGSTPVGNSGLYEELDGGFYKVQIDITQRTSNLRIQPSTAPAMDVWYVGWFSWVVNGFPGERLPLHFENSSFLAPPDVTGFMYQLNQGNLGAGRWTRRTKREYVDFCLPADAS